MFRELKYSPIASGMEAPPRSPIQYPSVWSTWYIVVIRLIPARGMERLPKKSLEIPFWWGKFFIPIKSQVTVATRKVNSPVTEVWMVGQNRVSSMSSGTILPSPPHINSLASPYPPTRFHAGTMISLFLLFSKRNRYSLCVCRLAASPSNTQTATVLVERG